MNAAGICQIINLNLKPYSFHPLKKKMGKSGKVKRAEPTDVGWIEKLPGCVELFQQARWMDFFKKIDGYNAEVSCKFAQGFKNDMVTFDTLKFKLTEG